MRSLEQLGGKTYKSWGQLFDLNLRAIKFFFSYVLSSFGVLAHMLYSEIRLFKIHMIGICTVLFSDIHLFYHVYRWLSFQLLYLYDWNYIHAHFMAYMSTIFATAMHNHQSCASSNRESVKWIGKRILSNMGTE